MALQHVSSLASNVVDSFCSEGRWLTMERIEAEEGDELRSILASALLFSNMERVGLKAHRFDGTAQKILRIIEGGSEDQTTSSGLHVTVERETSTPDIIVKELGKPSTNVARIQLDLGEPRAKIYHPEDDEVA
jgi:hypothetical protein